MRDGSVVFVDTRTRPNVGDVVTQYTNQLYPFDVKNSNQLVSVPERVYSITKKSHNTVTNMAFINSNYFVTGSDNGANGIKCWDLRYLSSKPERSCVVNYNFPREHFGRHFGVSDIKLDEKNSKFYVCCTNSRTYAFDSKTTNNNPLFVLQDTNSSVDISDPFFRKMSVSPHSNSVFIGSSKGNPQVFDLNKYKENMYLPIAKYEISGHSEPICNAQFSNDGKHLISISDHMLRVWEYGWDNCLLDCDLNIVNIQKPIEITQHISTIEKTHRSYNIEFDVKSAKLGYPLATGKKISTPSRAKKGIKRKPNDGHDEEPVIKSKYYPIFNGLERVNSEPTTP
uniref:WD_REPEATS_REGION domain-containing protein n=1 Tax=Rhabditophanes sp. KR3021 TaxID=114890 RepID=A0AC35TNK9_9BILA